MPAFAESKLKYKINDRRNVRMLTAIPNVLIAVPFSRLKKKRSNPPTSGRNIIYVRRFCI